MSNPSQRFSLTCPAEQECCSVKYHLGRPSTRIGQIPKALHDSLHSIALVAHLSSMLLLDTFLTLYVFLVQPHSTSTTSGVEEIAKSARQGRPHRCTLQRLRSELGADPVHSRRFYRQRQRHLRWSRSPPESENEVQSGTTEKAEVLKVCFLCAVSRTRVLKQKDQGGSVPSAARCVTRRSFCEITVPALFVVAGTSVISLWLALCT